MENTNIERTPNVEVDKKKLLPIIAGIFLIIVAVFNVYRIFIETVSISNPKTPAEYFGIYRLLNPFDVYTFDITRHIILCVLFGIALILRKKVLMLITGVLYSALTLLVYMLKIKIIKVEITIPKILICSVFLLMCIILLCSLLYKSFPAFSILKKYRRIIYFLMPISFIVGFFAAVHYFKVVWFAGLSYNLGTILHRIFIAKLSFEHYDIMISLFALALPTLLISVWAFANPKTKKPDSSSDYSYAYKDMVSHVLLLLFTCGIYYLVWIYRMTESLNACKNEGYRSPVKKLLLCMFIPFYLYYWTYKSADRIDMLGYEKGIKGDTAAVSTVLSIFLPILAPIFMQNKLNTVIITREPKPPKEQPSTGYNDLEKLKEYYDKGIITEEEFTEKKKQLLGI